eukprot:2501685-Rhodomonas_salina.1
MAVLAMSGTEIAPACYAECGTEIAYGRSGASGRCRRRRSARSPPRYPPTPSSTLSAILLCHPTHCPLSSYAILRTIRYPPTPSYALSDILLRQMPRFFYIHDPPTHYLVLTYTTRHKSARSHPRYPPTPNASY